jgi:MFS family permease
MQESCTTADTTPAARSGTPAKTRARRLPHSAAFVAIAAILVSFMAASSAPSPLYVVYQQEWRLSATTLTVVYAVYVLGVMASLLVLGALSDHIGRRPVLASAITLEVVALVLFLTAGGVPVLLLARIVQGIATGAAMSSLSATLVDLNPPHARARAGIVNSVAPIGGLALGALGCGVLVQFAPAPTHLIYALLFAVMVMAFGLVVAIPETSGRRPGASASLAPRLGIPARLRGEVFALVPILIASWAVSGLYLSLGPSVAAGLFGLTNHLVGGLVVTVLCGTAAVAAVPLRARPPARVLVLGASLLIAGTALTLTGVLAHSVGPAVAGTVVAGVGFGASFLASFGTLARICTPAERSELFAVGYLIAYLASSVPAVAAGVATTATGLRPTMIVYAIAVMVLSAAALVAQHVRRAPRPGKGDDVV